MFTNYPDNPAFDDLADASREAAELREQVAALTAELTAAKHALFNADITLNHARANLDMAYAELANARDDAAAIHRRYHAARKVAARLRRDYTYRGQFIEAQLQQPAPVAAQPAATVRMDSYGAFVSSIGATCDEDQKCEACDGKGEYTAAVCGHWETFDCPDCDGLGARRDTALYQERQAKRAADLEAARNAPIPF